MGATAGTPEEAPEGTPSPVLFDATSALQRLGGDRSVLARLMDHFLGDNATIEADLLQALEQGRPEDAVTMAHTLAGAAGNLGLDGLYRSARHVVSDLRQGVPSQSDIHELGTVMEQHLDCWQVLLDSIHAPTEAPLPQGAMTPAETQGEPPPAEFAMLISALADRDFRSVDLYAVCRPWFHRHHADLVPTLDNTIQLLNFKDASALLTRTFRPVVRS